jgi:3-deoxy-7-phosphoheptulonate synthase
MILRLQRDQDAEAIQSLRDSIESRGLRTYLSPDRERPTLAIVDKVPEEFGNELEALPEVARVFRSKHAWRLVDRAFREIDTVVDISGVPIGGESVAVIAGPCSVEDPAQMKATARCLAESGAHILRGGAFKPRTSPYSFQGLGVEGLRQLKDAGESVGAPVVSEIMDAADLPAFLDHDIDCLQVGARNMQNFRLLKAIAQVNRPVLLKRGLSATLDEWLFSAEYLAAGGCSKIVLCERGIRTFETATRNTLDLTVLPLLALWTHLPVIVDPSHAGGIAHLVTPLSRAAIAAGASGVAVEVHPEPEKARSDGPQSLLPGELALLVSQVRVQAAVTGRRLASPRVKVTE